MSMYPEMDVFSEFGSAAGGFALGFMAVYLLLMLLSLVYSIVVYILQSLGLYRIAQRRGIHHPWLAWIPVGCIWILGSISDQYQYVAKGNVRNRRKILMGLMIAMYALLAVIFVAAIILGVGAAETAVAPSSMGMGVVGPVILLVVCYLAMFVIAIITTVYQYIAYYDLFTSCKPNHAVAFLVLGILFNFLLPFFVFACRKKDEGMPPRRAGTQQPVDAIAEAVQPEEEPVYVQPEDAVTDEDFEPEEE